MPRAPFQILVFPYRVIDNNEILYAVFKRSDADYWQAIAGGGEDDETQLEAARRESFEEAGIKSENEFVKLDSFSSVPAEGISGMIWGQKVLVVPQYCFAVEVKSERLKLSTEHTEYRWLNYEEAHAILHYDSNKNALWELNYRLTRLK
jgi:dATP pyrophosphohydrolase